MVMVSVGIRALGRGTVGTRVSDTRQKGYRTLSRKGMGLKISGTDRAVGFT